MNKEKFFSALADELELPFNIEDVDDVEIAVTTALNSAAAYIDLKDGTTYLLTIEKTPSL